MAKTSKTADAVVGVVSALGPTLSSAAVSRLQEAGISADAARQQVSRALKRNALDRIRGISFPHGETFLFTHEQREADYPELLKRLWSELDKANSSAAVAIHSLIARGGIAPSTHFDILSGAPRRLSKHLGSDRVLEFLLRYGVATLREVRDTGTCIQIDDNFPSELEPSPARMKARLLAEKIVIDYVVKYYRNLGLIGYESAKTRENNATFGQFAWDMTAPSYAYPFVSRVPGRDPVPGFVVADVVLGTTISREQLRYFVNKSGVMRRQKNTRPFLAMMISDGFTQEAYNWARREGILAIVTPHLIGKEAAEALTSMIKTMANAAAIVANNPEAISNIFDKLAGVEGAAANLRGPLFELIVAHSVREKQGNSVDIGRDVFEPGTGNKTDVDVLRVKENQEVGCYECKGHSGQLIVERPEVELWLKRTIHIQRKYLQSQERFSQSRQIFEFWTTGSFSPEAIQLLKTTADRTKKYDIKWKDGHEVLEYVQGIKTRRLALTLQEHYLRHPLTKLERQFDLEGTTLPEPDGESPFPDAA